jgi:cobalt/nickel transport system permease protein
LDRLAAGHSWLHRIDPRVKLGLGLGFAVAVVSVPKYALPSLAPMLLVPVLMAALAGFEPLPLLARAWPAAGVALMLGAFNPLLDPQRIRLLGWDLSAGWLSLAVMLAKALLVAGMALVLVASSGFARLADSLGTLGAPRLFVQQMQLLWRYAGLLAEESDRLKRARDLRDPRGVSRGPRLAARLIGGLLARSLARAERIHQGMLCRGFNGALPGAAQRPFSAADGAALLGGAALIAACRLLPLVPWAQAALERMLP